MEKCVNAAKKLIDDTIKYNALPYGVEFSEYHRVYFTTNENINGYISQVNLDGKDNALSVLASGDHAFNLITKGIINIDTFDVNKLTEYISLGLKRAMILKYSYEEFLAYTELLCYEYTSIEFITDTIKELLPFMDMKYRMFWQEVLDYNFKSQKTAGTDLNLIKILCANTESYLRFSDCNNYLLNKENYNILKDKIIEATITFKCANAMELTSYFDKSYDVIMLSNILDYADGEWGLCWTYEHLKQYEEDIEKLSNDNGIVFLSYVFSFNSSDPGCYLIDDSMITVSDLTDEELLTFPNASSDKTSAMILKRIKR